MDTINKIQTWLQDKLRNKRNIVWVLLLIVLIGTALRTYNHRAWLYFDDDQANDFIKIDNFLKGEIGWPLLGPDMGNTNFHLGPIINYFQIISVKIFGFDPGVMAFPEVFFSILTIPLFYIFFKRYFGANLSLALTGLYSVSYFALKFSRFAWNTNTMPFFILLFLLSLTEFLFRKEKTDWRWVVGAGVALGVGVQLHAMLLVIFPVLFLGVMIITLRKSYLVWLKWVAVILVALTLNFPQIYFDFTNNFQNSRSFFQNAQERSGSGAGDFVNTLALDTACHIQANTFMLTTWGEKDNCNFLDTKIGKKNGTRHFIALRNPLNALIIAFSLGFSVWGYFLFFRNIKEEKDRKKRYFLVLVGVYLILFFLIMFPSIDEAPLRYFLPVFFVPYLFLGFFVRYFEKKFLQKAFALVVILFTLVATSNVVYLSSVAYQLYNKSRSGKDDVILGEIEPMKDYIVQESAPQKTAYLTGGRKYIFRFYKPISVLAEQMDFDMQRVGGKKLDPRIPVFYVYKSYPEKNMKEIKGMEIVNYKNFGGMAVYEVIKKDN